MSLRKIVLPVLILIFCLPGCVKNQALDTRNNENPFAATGLLAYPGETAEEILLRAHSMDSGAATLVVTGYILGIGGFPKDGRLADFYYYLDGPTGYYTTVFFDLMSFHNGCNDFWNPTPYRCAEARRSFAAPLLKQAGLFDLDSVCASIGYAEGASDLDLGEHDDLLQERIIELAKRPMNRQDVEFFKKLYHYNDIETFLGYYIATGGNREASIQEKQFNLLQFIAQRRVDPLPESIKLLDAATETLMRISSDGVFSSVVLEVVHKAHLGDPVAARQMAENYRTGTMGFPKKSSMVYAWLDRAFSAGDRKALDSLALWSYSDKMFNPAWKSAHKGLYYGSPELKDQFVWIIQESEKEFSVNELKQFKQELAKELEQLKASGFQTK